MSLAVSVARLLGLARRAGALAYGARAAQQAVRDGEACLVLLAGDASPTQLHKVRRALEIGSVPHVISGDRAALGAAIGLPPISAVAVTSPQLAGRITAELGGIVQRRVRDAMDTVVAAAVAAAEE